MGHKINPIGFRLGINRTWDSRWYADDNYADLLHEDIKIREFLTEKLKQASVSKIIIERPAKKARVTIYSARPGVVIGKRVRTSKSCAKKSPKSPALKSASTLLKSASRKSMLSWWPTILGSSSNVVFRPAARLNALCSRLCVSVLKVFASTVPAVWVALKSLVPFGIVKVVCRCTPCVPKWITLLLPLTPLMGYAESKFGSIRAISSLMIRWRPRKKLKRSNRSAKHTLTIKVGNPANAEPQTY